MADATRVPVCAACLKSPEPLSADYFCSSCRTPFQNGFPLDEDGRCALCRTGQRGFDAAYCFGSYEGVLRKLIQLYKYSGMRPLAATLSGLLSSALPRDQRFDLVTPVPLHWWREWRRGFNQSELLAAEIARRTAIPMIRTLARVRATANQAGLSNRARRDNVAAAFRCRRVKQIEGKHVLLIDDVMTTGSTAAACARALKRAGAERVSLLTVARVDRRLSGWSASGERILEGRVA